MSSASGGTEDGTTKKEDTQKKENPRYRARREEKLLGTLSAKAKHKYQLDKLMDNPDKPVEIPDRPQDWKPPEPPEFKRFYMGSSAGAGSEVFHVYRHLRRYETLRQDWIRETAEKEDRDLEFEKQMAEKKNAADQKTAKKRAKRLKKKQAKLNKLQEKKGDVTTATTTAEMEREESEDESEGKEDDAFENPFTIKRK